MSVVVDEAHKPYFMLDIFIDSLRYLLFLDIQTTDGMVFKPMAKKKEKGKQARTGQVQVSVRFPDVTILPDIKESRKESGKNATSKPASLPLLVAATMLDKRYSCCGVHVKVGEPLFRHGGRMHA